MSVKFKIQMTTQAMYSFKLHHTYTRLPGILGGVLGVIIFMLGVRRAEEGSIAGAVLLFLLAAVILVYPPAVLRIRVKRQAEISEAFREPFSYELADYGVTEVCGKKVKKYSWSDFRRAVSTNQALVLYLDTSRAVIFPRAQIGEKWAAAVEMISTHMPPDKVRIRQVN